jgi:hypothetical protein
MLPVGETLSSPATGHSRNAQIASDGNKNQSSAERKKMKLTLLCLTALALSTQAHAGGSTGGYTSCSTPNVRCPSGKVLGCNAIAPDPTSPTSTYNTCSWGDDWVSCSTTYNGYPYSEVSDSCN